MRILLLTQFCTPEPIIKSVPFAAGLIARGHEVRILTGYPSYPLGRYYDGYGLRCWMRERIEGVPILRVPNFPSHGSSIAGRIANYLSFPLAASIPLFAGWKPDVIYIYNLVTLGLLARLHQDLRDVPYVMDVQDLWPDSVMESGMGRSWMRGLLNPICELAYRGAARLVALSPGMAEELGRRRLAPKGTRCIYNWTDEREWQGESSPGPVAEFEGRFNILYAGNMGSVQSLDSVIDAAVITARECPKIQFVLMGGGVCADELRRRASSVAPRAALVVGPRPWQEAAAAMSMADALLVHLAPKPLCEFTIPSKTQAYLSQGRPVLAAVGRDAASLVTRSGAGVVAQPGNPRSIADAAIRLASLPPSQLRQMGESGRAFYQEHLSMRAGLDQWESVFREVVGTRSGKRAA